MRISVVLPEDLSQALQARRREERTPLSVIVRNALRSYLTDRQRRAAGDTLTQAALANPLDSHQVRAALQELEDGRARSDRI
jgi:metal-responsive CopG/Arc/MetJ family transcriptional regulator